MFDQDQAKLAIVKVGEGGRGFVIEGKRGRLVVTAAHCIHDELREPHPWAEREQRNFLGRVAPTPLVRDIRSQLTARRPPLSPIAAGILPQVTLVFLATATPSIVG